MTKTASIKKTTGSAVTLTTRKYSHNDTGAHLNQFLTPLIRAGHGIKVIRPLFTKKFFATHQKLIQQRMADIKRNRGSKALNLTTNTISSIRTRSSTRSTNQTNLVVATSSMIPMGGSSHQSVAARNSSQPLSQFSASTRRIIAAQGPSIGNSFQDFMNRPARSYFAGPPPINQLPIGQQTILRSFQGPPSLEERLANQKRRLQQETDAKLAAIRSHQAMTSLWKAEADRADRLEAQNTHLEKKVKNLSSGGWYNPKNMGQNVHKMERMEAKIKKLTEDNDTLRKNLWAYQTSIHIMTTETAREGLVAALDEDAFFDYLTDEDPQQIASKVVKMAKTGLEETPHLSFYQEFLSEDDDANFDCPEQMQEEEKNEQSHEVIPTNGGDHIDTAIPPAYAPDPDFMEQTELQLLIEAALIMQNLENPSPNPDPNADANL